MVGRNWQQFVTDLALTLLVLLLEWRASKYVAYLDYYCDYDGYYSVWHFDSLDVNQAKTVDTHDVTIAGTMDAPMILHNVKYSFRAVYIVLRCYFIHYQYTHKYAHITTSLAYFQRWFWVFTVVKCVFGKFALCESER